MVATRWKNLPSIQPLTTRIASVGTSKTLRTVEVALSLQFWPSPWPSMPLALSGLPLLGAVRNSHQLDPMWRT